MARRMAAVPVAGAMTTGRLIPRLLGAIGALIVFTGFLPLSWFGFKDYEIARHVLQWNAPFRPNLYIRSTDFVAADAATGNLKPTETAAPRTFSTDALGFRYTPPVRPQETPSVLVFRGFSFIFGVGLSDEQTFPAALSRELGENVYNGARFLDDPETPGDLDHLLRTLRMQPKTVVYVHLEPNAQTLAEERQRALERAGEAIAGPGGYERVDHFLWFAREFPMQWIRTSPVIHAAAEAKKALENDRILTNRYRENVRAFWLPNGARMLVRTGDLERDQTDFAENVVSERAEYIAWWKDQLAARGLPMLVLLVPDKMSVYGPALGLRMPSDPFLTRLARQLTARGVTAIDGLPLLRAHAAEDLTSGRLAYRREDEHWTALGVDRLAHAVSQAIKTEPAWFGQSALIPTR
jgi:hypothetical protein